MRLVSCYTFFNGFQLPWPPPSCYNEPTPLRYLMSEQFGTLTQREVDPSSPVLLTKNGPLRILHVIRFHLDQKNGLKPV